MFDLTCHINLLNLPCIKCNIIVILIGRVIPLFIF
uniref:Uncharacterized protein n=1 Tax=Rhizophora mucronata TaxID=61149 RepID=A0A2P2QH57_RHIMU